MLLTTGNRFSTAQLDRLNRVLAEDDPTDEIGAPWAVKELRRQLLAEREPTASGTARLAPTHVGLPDRLVLLPGGRIILAELKTERGGLSVAQMAWHAQAADRQPLRSGR